ncbi:MAG TPA: hypothetical protein VMW52_13610 [Phycisphaerae bacterium]|nr:hypothetical protein [Phycisphaerae bacterium]
MATLVTMTTYGTWLRGNARGWVDAGTIFPPSPALEDADRRRMKHPVFKFAEKDWQTVGSWMGMALAERTQTALYAMTVQPWHVHLVVAPSGQTLSHLVKCAKDAARWGLRAGRPIWAGGYDKRFCFDEASAAARIAYVERHNVACGRPARPWTFLVDPPFATRNVI